MPITMFRGNQFRESTVTQVNVDKGYVDLSSEQTVGGAKTLTSALITAAPTLIVSNSGVVTLTKDSNTFIVDGAELVTRIQGWGSGGFSIQWKQDRVIKNVPNYLELQGGNDRAVMAGDFSSFMFVTPSLVVETGYFGRSNATQDASNITFVTVVDDGTTEVPLNAVPAGKDMLIVAVNGSIQDPNSYTLADNLLTFDFGLSADDTVFAFVIAKALTQGSITVDGGVF